MNKLKQYLPRNILRTIFNSLMLPHFNYSILVWGFKSSRISKLQKSVVRMISCSKYNADTEPLLLILIEDVMKNQDLHDALAAPLGIFQNSRWPPKMSKYIKLSTLDKIVIVISTFVQY